MKFHGQCAVVENAKAFDRVRERDCGNVTLKEVDGNEGQFKEVLSCNGVLQLQKLSPLCWEPKANNFFVLKPLVDQNIAMHASSLPEIVSLY